MDAITDKTELLSVKNGSNKPVLEIVTTVTDDVTDEYSSESTGDYSSESEEEVFYVEFNVACDLDGAVEILPVLFNFETDENYIHFDENGSEDIDEYIEDYLGINHPEYEYNGEWEFHTIHGDVFPDDFEGIPVDIL